MSRAAEAFRKAGPHAPAFFLLLAVAAGGLRSPSAWLAFGAVFLFWLALSPRGLSSAGLRAPVLFFAWLAAAALFSPAPAASISVFSRYAVLGFLFFYAASSEEGGGGWLAVLSGLGAAAALVFIFERIYNCTPAGFIGANPGYSAAFCAAAFPPALLVLSGPAGRKEKIYNAALALLLAAGIFASVTRSAALAAFLSAAAGLCVMRRWGWLAALLTAGLAGLALLPVSAWEGLLKLGDPHAFERPLLWGSALEAAAARPLLGWGPGLFGSVFETFKFPYFDGLSFYGHSTLHAHSEILNLAAEAGFPAAALFLLTAASALLSGGRERLPLKLCALAVLIQGGTNMIFYSGAVALLYWGSLGFAAAAGRAPAEGLARAKQPAGSACSVKTALAALCFAGLAAAPAAELLNRREAAVARPSYIEQRGKNPALALALARSPALDRPKDPFAAADEAQAFAAAGDAAGAEAAFGRALSLEPGFAGARLGLALVHAAARRTDEACAGLAFLEKAPAAAPRNAYQRGLVHFDRAAAEKIKKDLCRKKKTGAATASRRRTR